MSSIMPVCDGSSHSDGRSAYRPKPSDSLDDECTGQKRRTANMYASELFRALSPSQMSDPGSGGLLDRAGLDGLDASVDMQDVDGQPFDDRDSDSAYHSPPNLGSQTPTILGRRMGTTSGSEDETLYESRWASPVSEATALTRSSTQITALTAEGLPSPPPSSLYPHELPPPLQSQAYYGLESCGQWATTPQILDMPADSQWPWSIAGVADLHNFNCNDPTMSRIPFAISECHTYGVTRASVPQTETMCRGFLKTTATLQSIQTSAMDLSSGNKHERDSEDVLTNGDTKAPVVEPCAASDNPIVGEEANETRDAIDRGDLDCPSVSSESELSSDESYVDSPDGSVVSPSSPHDDMLQALLEERKTKVVDEVMEHFWELFKELELECPRSPSTLTDDDADSTVSSISDTSETLNGLTAFEEPLSGWGMRHCEYQTNPGDAGENSGGAHECGTNSAGFSFGSTPSSSQGKRKAADASPSGGQGGGDGSKKQKPDPSGDPESPSQTGSSKRLGCPYYKRQIMKGERVPPKSTSCVIPGFSSISRMKEHLYRHHKRPIQCPRCFEAFTSVQQFNTHLTAEDRCTISPPAPPMDGFDSEQEVQLKSKKRSRGTVTTEQKWRDVYKILFPDDLESAYPNPYCEYEQGDAPSTPSSEELAQFDAYSRQELPRLVRAGLERAVNRDNGLLRETLMSELVDLIRDCQGHISVAFRQGAATPARAHEAHDRGGQQPVRAANRPVTVLGGVEVVPEAVQAPTPIADEGASNVPTIEETRLSRSSAESPKPENDSGYGPSVRSRLRFPASGTPASSQRTPGVDRSNATLQQQLDYQYPNMGQINQQPYGTYVQAPRASHPQQMSTAEVASIFTPHPQYDITGPSGNSFDDMPLDCWGSNGRLPQGTIYPPPYSASSEMAWSTSTPHSTFDFSPVGRAFSAPFQPQVSTQQSADTAYPDVSSMSYHGPFDGRTSTQPPM